MSYRAIAAHQTVVQLYAKRLKSEGIVSQDQLDDWQVGHTCLLKPEHA